MIGSRGIKAGAIASLVFITISTLFFLAESRFDSTALTNLVIDAAVAIIAGAILGFIFNFIEKPFFFAKPYMKAQVYGLIIGLLLGLSGRGGLLMGPNLYSRIIQFLNIPLLSDFIVSIIAGFLWGVIMGGVYTALGPKKKELPISQPTASVLGRIQGFLRGTTRRIPPQPQRQVPPGYIACPRCGTLNSVNARFCLNCGQRLK